MNSNNYRARLLNGASVAVIASTLGVAMSLGMGAAAHAAGPTGNLSLNATGTTANHLVGASSSGVSNQTNQYVTGPQSATITTAQITYTAGGSNGPSAVITNLTQAIAIGNQDPGDSIAGHPLTGSPYVTLTYDLAGIGSGSAESVNQVNVGHTVTSSVTTSSDYIAIGTGLTNGSVTVGGSTYGTGNTIEALTILNTATTGYSGTIPTGFSSTTTGSAALNYVPPVAAGTTILTTQGSVDLMTSQVASLSQAGAGSYADLTSNSIYATPDYQIGETISGLITVSNNTMAATYQGNYADESISVLAGGDGTFNGSLTLATVQVNQPDATTVPALAASNAGSQVYVTLNPTTSGTDTLTGSIAIQGNTISSSATGNLAYTPHYDSTTGSLVSSTGNVISLGSGVSFVGAGSTLSDTVSYAGSGQLAASVTADVVLSNIQANLASPLSASTTGGEVAASIQDMSLGSGNVSVGGNAITSSVSGNVARNVIVGGSMTDNFSGTIGAQNVQTNDLGTNFLATVSGSSVSVEAGTSDLSATGAVVGATIEVGSQTAGAGNSIGASAYGNQAGTYVDLTYNTVTNAAILGSYATGVAIEGNRSQNVVGAQNLTSTPIAFPNPGAAIISVQSNLDDTTVSSVNSGSSVTLSVGNAIGLAPVTGSTLGVDNNSLTSTAVGNSSGTGFTINTATLQGNAGIGSVQTQVGLVSSSLSGGTVSLTVIPDIDASTATVTGNTLMSEAQANYASNSITLDTGSYGSNNGGGASQRITIPSATPFDAVVGSGAYAYGGLAMLNEQLASSGVTASNTTGGVTLTFSGDLGTGTSVTATNSDNTIGAQAGGNQAMNSIALTSNGGTLAGQAATGSSLTVVTNIQQVSTPAILASVTTSGGSPVLTDVIGTTTNATVTMSGNQYTGLAVGNAVTNSVAATGATAIDWASPESAQAIQLQGLDLVQVYGLNIVNNGQYTGAGTITSYVRGNVAAEFGDTVTGSTVTLDSNAFTSTAYDNQATNLAQIAATDSLGGTQAIFNNQISAANTVASAGSFFNPTSVTITGSDFTSSTLNVTNNTSTATAIGNVATNSMTSSVTTGGSTTITAGIASGNLATSFTTGLSSADQGVHIASSYGVGTGVGGDYVIGNLQQLSGNVTAYTVGGAGVVTSGDQTNVTSTVSNNVYQANAEGNVATNTAIMSITNGSAAAVPAVAIGSVQIASGSGTQAVQTIRANASNLFGVFNAGTVTGGTITVSGNAANAVAQLNTATNALTVSSGNSLGSDYGVGYGQAMTVSALNPGLASSAAVADYAVSNTQTSAFGSVSATASAGSFFLPSGINVRFDDISGATLSVTGNQVFAQAGVNTASNSLTLSAFGTFSATSAVLNMQSNSSNAIAGATGNLGIYLSGPPSSTATSSVLSVGSNAIVATAWGNSATNSVTATAVNGYTGYTTTLLTVPGPGAASGTNTVEAGHVVLNEQVNSGNVTSTVGGRFGAQIGITSFAGQDTNVTMSVNGNSMEADAVGNSASNSMVLNGQNGSGAIGNGQVNSGAISASVNSAFIGINTGGFTGSGTVTGGALNVSNNMVTASAIGNNATNNLVLNGIGASGGVASTQVNTGAETASISGVTIGIVSNNVVNASSAVVSGNQIIAMAVGNASTTTTHH